MEETNYPVEYLTHMRDVYQSRFDAQAYLRKVVYIQIVKELTVRAEIKSDAPTAHNGVNWETHTFPESSIDSDDLKSIVWDTPRRINEIQRFANFLYNDHDYILRYFDDDDRTHIESILAHKEKVHRFWDKMKFQTPTDYDPTIGEEELIALFNELIDICR